MKMKRLLWGFLMIAAVALAGCGGNGGSSATDPANGNGMNGNGTPTAAEVTVADVITYLNTQGATLAPDASGTEILDEIKKLDPEDEIWESFRSELNMPNATPNMILTAVEALVAEDMRTEDPIATKKASAIVTLERGTNNAEDRGTATAPVDDLENPNRPGKGEADAGTDDLFTVAGGGIDLEEVMTVAGAVAADNDRLGMPDSGVVDENEFEMMADGMVGDFARNVHTRTIDEVTDTLTVFDNRDDPTDVEFETFYSEADAGSRDAVASATVSTESGPGVVTIDTTDIAGNSGLFESTNFPAATTGEGLTSTLTYDTDADKTFSGSFNGVDGTYACTGECSAESNNDGLSALEGTTWIFTPDAVAEDADPHMIEDANFDADYLAFGYWLQETGTGADKTYGIGTFATGSMAFPVGTTTAGIPALVGTATYSGSAGGMFVMKADIDDDNKGLVATQAGEFTADASLTAKFGSATGSETDFIISGTVDNFAHADGTAIDNDWSLDLDSTEFADRAYSGNAWTFSEHANTFSGSTTSMEGGTAGSTAGRWEGGFYGPTVTDVDTTIANEAETGYPTGVAGEFIGHFENADVIGAFGAEKNP